MTLTKAEKRLLESIARNGKAVVFRNRSNKIRHEDEYAHRLIRKGLARKECSGHEAFYYLTDVDGSVAEGDV